VSKENTIKQLKDKLSECPLCGSEDGYSISPSNYVFQCNACGAKFVSNDLKKVDSEFKEMGLFSPPSEMDNHANREALESIKFKHYPIEFWKNMDIENIALYLDEYEYELKKETEISKEKWQDAPIAATGILQGIPTQDQIEEINNSDLDYIMIYDQSLIGVFNVKPIQAINKLSKHGWKPVTMSTHTLNRGIIGPASYMYAILERTSNQ